MRHHDEPDDDLRAMLGAADPARSLDPLPHDRITRMVNLASSPQNAPTAPRRAPRRPLLVGLGGTAALAAAAFVAVSALTPSATAATQLVLPAGDGGMAAGACPVLAPELLSPLPLAVEGEVTAVSDGLVTLHVSHVFRGDPGTVVEVRRPAAAEGDYSAFEFTLGQDYLLAAGDIDPAEPALEIALCGLSGPASPELRDAYDKAFR